MDRAWTLSIQRPKPPINDSRPVRVLLEGYCTPQIGGGNILSANVTDEARLSSEPLFPIPLRATRTFRNPPVPRIKSPHSGFAATSATMSARSSSLKNLSSESDEGLELP